MATRFYLRNTTEVTGISPTPSASWEDTSALVRAKANTTPTSDPFADVTFPDDGDDTDKDCILRQYVSEQLTPGQTVTGSQAIEMQCRCNEVDSSNNMYLALGIRIIASDGSTVQKTVLDVTRDNTEMNSTVGVIKNRRLTATSAATDYTTVSGDRIVIEIGGGGDPSAAGVHEFILRLGDASGADLPEDDVDEDDDNPWVEITDTLTFGTGDDGTNQAFTDNDTYVNSCINTPVVVEAY